MPRQREREEAWGRKGGAGEAAYLLYNQHGVALDDDLLGAELDGSAKAEDDALVLRLIVGLSLAKVLVPAAKCQIQYKTQRINERTATSSSDGAAVPSISDSCTRINPYYVWVDAGCGSVSHMKTTTLCERT